MPVARAAYNSGSIYDRDDCNDGLVIGWRPPVACTKSLSNLLSCSSMNAALSILDVRATFHEEEVRQQLWYPQQQQRPES